MPLFTLPLFTLPLLCGHRLVDCFSLLQHHLETRPLFPFVAACLSTFDIAFLNEHPLLCFSSSLEYFALLKKQ